jgi:4-hydroxybenzoate polyprenyltransferase
MTAMVMGFHAYSTIMDYSVDKKIGVKTFATIFGKRNASFLLTHQYYLNQLIIIFLAFVAYCFLLH